MSKVLGIVRRDAEGTTLRVRCAWCRRIYVTRSTVASARRQDRCAGCRYDRPTRAQERIRRLERQVRRLGGVPVV